MSYLELPLAKKPIRDPLPLASIENPDWGYARNTRCVLMTPSAEWIQSVYSCSFEVNGRTFIAPNRDYPYEGLLVYQGGENWKFIDCIGLALQHPEGWYIPFAVDSSCPTVRATPWKVTYHYKVLGTSVANNKVDAISFFISYYLNSRNTPELVTGCVELYFPDGLVYGSVGITPIIQPFIDIRHMYDPSSFDYSRTEDLHEGGCRRFHFRRGRRTLTFYLPPVESKLFDAPERLHWYYKLGTGARTESPDHRTVFIGEEKWVAAFFNLRIPPSYQGRFVRLFFCCGLSGDPERFYLPALPLPDIEREFEESRKKDSDQFLRIKRLFPLSRNMEFRDAIMARIVGLTKFKIHVRLAEPPIFRAQVPHAGAWWFKTPWYRDVFEGILNSFDTLMRIPEEKENTENIILLALRTQDEPSGRILNRIPHFKNSEGDSNPDYNTSDATLLCFIAANAYVQRTRDLDFALEILPYAMKTVHCFQKGNVAAYRPYWVDGPPRVDRERGLLLSVPRHSWIDTETQRVNYDGQEIKRLPNRVSKEFIRALYDQIENKERLWDLLSSPEFFLPEINAQWITMLKGTIETVDFVNSHDLPPGTDRKSIDRFREIVQDMLTQAIGSFKRVFWNDDNGFLFNVVYENRIIKDATECEAGVTAAAMLGKAVFTQTELFSIWDCTWDKLLVRRRLVKYGLGKYGKETLPFGIITRNVPQQVYYGDAQYHSDVVWLRSTPYLIRLLRLLNQDETIEQILTNTLDHQMTEGAIYYNQELLARPSGNNPHPDEYTRGNPVPVKNPIQFWSQWCDAFIEFFGERRN